MPLYGYRRLDNGEYVELVMSIAEMTRRQGKHGVITLDNGAKAERCYDRQKVRSHLPGCWPKVSSFAGVHPDQIAETKQHLGRAGCPTEFTPQGDAIFESRSHRKSYLKAMGMRDNDGGYGD